MLTSAVQTTLLFIIITFSELIVNLRTKLGMGMIQFEIICFHPDRVHNRVLSVCLSDCLYETAFVENGFLVSVDTKFIKIVETVEAG